jgi:hypothetical protein
VHFRPVRVSVHQVVDIRISEPLRQLADQQHSQNRLFRLQQADDQLFSCSDGGFAEIWCNHANSSGSCDIKPEGPSRTHMLYHFRSTVLVLVR